MDVGADMVVVDLAEVRDAHRMVDQLGIEVAGRRRRLRRLQPAQVLGLRQKLFAEPAKGGFCVGDLARGSVRVLGKDHADLRYRFGQALGPTAGRVGLRRQHDELEGIPAGHDGSSFFQGQMQCRPAQRRSAKVRHFEAPEV